jgi:hypothetical protein
VTILTLIINGSPSDRIIIYNWLREICSEVQVDRLNGYVFLIARPDRPIYISGCNSLDKIASHRRVVTINAIPYPTTPLPPPYDTINIKIFGGGAITIFEPYGSIKNDDNSPGKGVDGDAGTNADVYIDMSNNYGSGYDQGIPMWLILAHELTGGHAFHAIHGTSEKDETGKEAQAIDSENRFRTEHRLPLRLKEPYNKEEE